MSKARSWSWLVLTVIGLSAFADSSVVAERRRALAVAESPPLRALQTVARRPGPVVWVEVRNSPYMDHDPRSPHYLVGASSPDAAVQSAWRAPAVMPAATSWEGLGNSSNVQLFNQSAVPPDTVGDIGPNHYVQGTNLNFGVWFRDGSSDPDAQGPIRLSQLFAALPNSACAGDDDGDPNVLYDHLADRWLISQFEVDQIPRHQCIAVSKTADPYGSWWVYDFEMPNNHFNDYPHFALWPDGYYMVNHEFQSIYEPPVRSGVFAFDRARMLVGDADASYVYFDLGSVMPGRFGLLAGDLDGPAPTPPRSMLIAIPIALETGDTKDGIRLFEFTPDFDAPAKASFVEAVAGGLTVAAYDPVSPEGRDDIPQPGMISTRYLDALSGRFMHRLQYRHFGAQERLTVAMTVDASGDVDPDVFRAGVRYYVLRRNLPAGAWQIEHQGTWAPADAAHRWMPSAALDADGNLAIGYSTSSSSIYPSLRYAGRLFTDPAGLAQGEASLQAGSAAQPLDGSRWGDYTALNLDPLDDCTFWFTGQYYAGNGLECGAQQAACWRTRVGKFKYPGCSAPAPGTLSGTVTNANSGLPVPGVQVAIGNGYFATSASDGTWSKSLASGSYALGASRSGYQSVTLPNVSVATGANTVVNFTMDGAPIFEPAGYTIDDALLGNGNGRADPDECFDLRLNVRNAGGGYATAVEGDIRVNTPAVATVATAPWPDLVPDAVVPNSPPFELAMGADYPAGRALTVLLRLESAQLARSFSYAVPVGVPNGPPIPFASAAAPVPIPVSTGETPAIAMLPVQVSGFDGAIRRMSAAVHVLHGFVGLLKLSLVAPDGTSILLYDGFDNGGNFGADCPAGSGDTVFDDNAAQSINLASPPFIGSFRPEVPLAAFVGKAGAQVNGTWFLRAENFSSTTSGELRCMTLTLNGYTYTPGQCNRPDALFADSFE